ASPAESPVNFKLTRNPSTAEDGAEEDEGDRKQTSGHDALPPPTTASKFGKKLPGRDPESSRTPQGRESAKRGAQRVRVDATDGQPSRSPTPSSKPQRGSWAPLSKVNVSKLPFFMWTTSGDGEATGDSAKVSTVSRLLSKVSTGLASREVAGKLYSQAYECS